MKPILLAVAALLVGAATFFALHRRTHRRRRRKRRKNRAETSKKVVWVCLVNGFAWVWCSYALAYLDKPQIAESLSQVAVTEIIGVVLAYCLKAAVENLSKNNLWPDKAAPVPEDDAEEPPDDGQGKEETL